MRILTGLDTRQRRLLVDTLFLGIIGALAAQVFVFLLRGAQDVLLVRLSGYRPPGLPSDGGVLHQMIGAHGLWLIPVATTLGGLISGILVYALAPEAEGHGTDTAVRAFHDHGGFIRTRVAPLKMLASAITIGSGGSAGREGPTALIAAGIGSLYGSIARRPEEDRQLLVLIGMAAGLSAVFRSPIGTAIFAIEVLYSEMEFESHALPYTMLGSIVAYAINGSFVGWKPLFLVPANVDFTGLSDYPWYILLGVLAGVIGTLLPVVFYRARDMFHSIPIPPHFKPALGGLGLGLLALALPQVLGGGYGWIQQAIDGQLALGLSLSLIFAKILAFALTVSSGGSGGVFAPTLYVGAMLGAATAQISHQPTAGLAIVGMAAVFAAAGRVPMATMLMVTEMTAGYRLLVPAALAVTISYLVQSILSSPLKYRTLYEAQVPRPADSPAHRAEQLRIALSLLDQEHISIAETVGHLNLVALLKLGIPVDLPDKKRLCMGVLRAESPCVGTPARGGCLFGDSDGEVVALLRAGHLFLPHANTVLNAGDQVLVLSSLQACDRLATHWKS